MTLLHRRDHVERGLSRLLSQFSRSANLRSLLAAYLIQVQDLEDGLWEVIEERLLANAEGSQLDTIGRLVRARGRAGLSDVDYRVAIQCQIRINRSSGRASDIIDVAKLSHPEGHAIRYREIYPCAVEVESTEVPADGRAPGIIRDNLRTSRAGGVGLSYIYTLTGSDDAFTLSASVGDTVSEDLGLSSVTDTDLGGALSGVMV